MLEIPQDKIVRARGVEGWNISIFGNPKLKVICGECVRLFSTRDYFPFTGSYGQDTVANCPYCGKWNMLGVVLT